MAKFQLTDRWGNPVDTAALTAAEPAQRIGTVRSPVSGYPADGLNPVALAQILREADRGNPVRYLELAEAIEERDPHYLGVMGTRKRSVSQLDITVEAASDAPADFARADLIRTWLKRDELTEELFDILDAVGKGYSFTRIIWDSSEGQWQPRRLDRHDPRWFRFRRDDLMTPVKLTDSGAEVPLDPFGFIFATISAKSGLHLRSGLARIAAWGWMFKAFTQRDWSIFAQTYGQPIRVGKYPGGTSQADQDTLYRAVAGIAGDCAAIVPDTMMIEFVEAKSVSSSSDLYERRADWIDRQTSKAVLGQTATTDAIAGGHAVGQEHRQVQADIERADARALAAILNRDLIRPWMELEFGPLPAYPRIRIERPEAEDLKGMADALAKLVPLGLRVEASEVRDRFGLSEPAKGAEILSAAAPAAPVSAPPAPGRILQRVGSSVKGVEDLPGVRGAEATTRHSTGEKTGGQVTELMAERMEVEAGPAVAGMIDQIEVMVQAAGSLEELGEMLRAAYPLVGSGALADVLARGLVAAELAGRVEAADEDV